MNLNVFLKNNKGFTLIELLSFIIILSIIAVVTVPELLGVLDEAKLDSAHDSAYGYKRALQDFSIKGVNFDNDVLFGSFTVDELKNMGLETVGHNPDGGIVLIDKEGISGCLQYNEYISILYNDDVINTVKGVCPKEKLVTSGDGLYKSEIDKGRFIYRGSEPNNWILLDEDGDGLNETLYRIISYEPDGTIKVIRDERISVNDITLTGSTSYDVKWDVSVGDTNWTTRDSADNTYCNYGSGNSYYGCNAWSNQNNTLYNDSSLIKLSRNFYYEYYESHIANVLTSNFVSGGTVKSESSLNIFLNSKIKNSDSSWQPALYLDKYIEKHSFNVSGPSYWDIYESEGGKDKGLDKEKYEESLLTWNGKIGLFNITEYVESSINPDCTSVFSNYYYNSNHNDWPCSSNDNWMKKASYNQEFLSPYSYGRDSVWYVHNLGYFDVCYVNSSYGVRPVFYLKSDIKLSGNGNYDISTSEGTPYEIIG